MTKLEQIARRHSDIYAGNDLDLPAPYYNILTALRELREELANLANLDSMNDWTGGSTGNAVGTKLRIVAAIRRFGEEESCNQAAHEAAEPRDQHRGGNSYEASMLRNLLARIHRDGGQYLEEHGLDKALEDAEAKIVEWIHQANLADAALVAEKAMRAVVERRGAHGYTSVNRRADDMAAIAAAALAALRELREELAKECERYTDPDDGPDSAVDTAVVSLQCAATIRRFGEEEV